MNRYEKGVMDAVARWMRTNYDSPEQMEAGEDLIDAVHALEDANEAEMLNRAGSGHNCSDCGHYIPDHVPGQGDCMHPSPKGCVEPYYPKWTGETVPPFALDYIIKTQNWSADREQRWRSVIWDLYNRWWFKDGTKALDDALEGGELENIEEALKAMGPIQDRESREKS
jgi:hypothetical protein